MELEGLAAQFSLYKEIAKSKLQDSEGASPVPGGSSDASSKNVSDDAVVSNLNQGAFSQKLYKHISDYYAGKGNLSSQTNKELNKKDSQISNILVTDNPSANAMYSAYRTASFTYGSEARFVSNIENNVREISKLKKVYG